MDGSRSGPKTNSATSARTSSSGAPMSDNTDHSLQSRAAGDLQRCTTRVTVSQTD
jgi:hypothetical protein